MGYNRINFKGSNDKVAKLQSVERNATSVRIDTPKISNEIDSLIHVLGMYPTTSLYLPFFFFKSGDFIAPNGRALDL